VILSLQRRAIKTHFYRPEKKQRKRDLHKKGRTFKGQSSLQWKETETPWLRSHQVSIQHGLQVLFLLQELPLSSHGFLGADSVDHSVSFVLKLSSLAICGDFGPLDSSVLCFYLSILGPIVP
jgi:hypothetical protein